MNRDELTALCAENGWTPTFAESDGLYGVSVNCNDWKQRGHNIWTRWHDTLDAAVDEAMGAIASGDWTQPAVAAPNTLALAAWASENAAGRVLEIGAGAGLPSLAAQQAGAEVVATDIDADAVSALIEAGLDAYVLDYTLDSPPQGPWDVGMSSGCDYSPEQVEAAARLLADAGCQRIAICNSSEMGADLLSAISGYAIYESRIRVDARCGDGGPYAYLYVMERQ